MTINTKYQDYTPCYYFPFFLSSSTFNP